MPSTELCAQLTRDLFAIAKFLLELALDELLNRCYKTAFFDRLTSVLAKSAAVIQSHFKHRDNAS